LETAKLASVDPVGYCCAVLSDPAEHPLAPACWLQCTKDRLERMQEKLSKTQLEKLGLDQKVGATLWYILVAWAVTLTHSRP